MNLIHPLLALFPPPDLPRVIRFSTHSRPEKISSSTALLLFLHRCPFEHLDKPRRREARGKKERSGEKTTKESGFLEEFYRSNPLPPRVIGPARRQSAIGQRKRSMNSPRKMYYRAAIIGNTRQDERDNIGV